MIACEHVARDGDFELLELWVEGDRRAGDRLVKAHYMEIARYFMSAVGDQERLELTQETFARLCSAAGRYEGRASFRSYLFGIARNVLNEFLRNRYRQGAFDPEVHSLTEIEQLSISRLVSQLVRNEVAMQCLRELPVELKQLMELYYWHDMTAGELSEMLKVPAATIRTRLHNARKALQKKIAEREPSIAKLDIEEQLEALGRLMGFGPQMIDGAEDPPPS